MAKTKGWFATIAEEIRAVRTDRASLRTFGVTMAVALAVLGALFLWRGKGGSAWLFSGSAVLLGSALVTPVLLKPVQRLWMSFAIVLGWVMTRVILIVLFYVGVTPVALVARLFGKRFLELGFDRDRASYWEKKPEPTRGVERYESQF